MSNCDSMFTGQTVVVQFFLLAPAGKNCYCGIPISQTSRVNANWFEKSGVREIESGIKLCLIGRVSCD